MQVYGVNIFVAKILRILAELCVNVRTCENVKNKRTLKLKITGIKYLEDARNFPVMGKFLQIIVPGIKRNIGRTRHGLVFR